MAMSSFDTHEVFNQSPPYEDVDLFASDRPLRDAVAAVRSFTENEGVTGLEEHSRRCFSVLVQSPNLRLLDYCVAFDSAATSLDAVAASARSTGSEAFFHPGRMSRRHAEALHLFFRDKSIAEARHSEIEAKTVSELMWALRI